VLGAGDPLTPPDRPTPIPARPKGRWFLASVVLALVALGAHRIWNAFFRYLAHGVVVGREIHVSPPWEGEIEAVHVREGDVVSQGDLLCSLSSLELSQDRMRVQDELRIAQADLSAELARVQLEVSQQEERGHKAMAEYHEALAELLIEEARAEVLQRSLERQLELFQSGVVSDEAFERLREETGGQVERVGGLRAAVEELRVRAELRTAGGETERLRPYVLRIEALQADLGRLGERMEQGQVRAPVSGTIVRRACFAGERARAGAALITILEHGSERIELFVPASLAAKLSLGHELVLEIEPNAELVRCEVESFGESYALPPPNLARYSIPSQALLPVRLHPSLHGSPTVVLRLGALARLPRAAS
jgi:HlyD family secretion protein